MKTKILLSDQVADYLGALAPEPRRSLRAGLKGLPVGDTRTLEGSLSGFWRLRVGSHRVIYAVRVEKGTRLFDCIYAERRAIVYALFEQLLAAGDAIIDG